ncbi:thermopsin [Stygiolobus caldivivus]|uniref:thermopsin n=1 Tax=Stygiolobus caldivivus TaxID=2824673 RepID=UPI001C84399A|nr:thermopsin [Stygiolobus caldivivus]
MLREIITILVFLFSIIPSLNIPSYETPFSPHYQFYGGTPSECLLSRLGESVKAPIGIADYGISPNGPFIRNTTQLMGVVKIYSLKASSTASYAPNSITFQLNAVISYQHDGKQYAIWVQNVLLYDTKTRNVVFVDNLWNFTSLHANVTGVKGSGNISAADIRNHYITFYYDYAETPGSNVTVSLPAEIMLLSNVTTNLKGEPVVCFWYNDGYGWQKYDEVTLTNAPGSTNVYFLIDGYNYTGNKEYYDAEFVIAGPGDGSCVDVTSSYLTLRLEYWNGHNFQEVRNAFNFGSDTGETAWGVKTSFYTSANGEPEVLITSGKQVLTQLWEDDQVSTLVIHTNIVQGNITVLPEHSLNSPNYSVYSVPFRGGEAVLTIVQGEFGIIVSNSSGVAGEANVVISSPGIYTVSITQFSVKAEGTVMVPNTGTEVEFPVNITAEGVVRLSVTSNGNLSISYPLSVSVNGSLSLPITVSAKNLTPAVYDVIINVTLLPGIWKVVFVKVVVISDKYTFNLTYESKGDMPRPYVVLKFPNGSSVNLQLPVSTVVPNGTVYNVERVIDEGDVRWVTPNSTEGIVNFTTTLSIEYFMQFLVNFTFTVKGDKGYGIPYIQYCYLGHLNDTAPGLVWADAYSKYSYPECLPGSGNGERWISFNYSGVISKPGEVINTYYYNQFFVNVKELPFPLYALINGSNTTLVSGWYNASDVIEVENITYYPKSGERYVILSVSPPVIRVNSPVNIDVNYVKQYLVTVESDIPLYALVNGSNITLTTGWYGSGDTIHVENISHYLNYLTREVPLNITPKDFVVESPVTVKVRSVTQYFITLISPIPVKLDVNGSPQEALGGLWLDSGSRVTILNYSFYMSPFEKCIITEISPETFNVSSPETVVIETEKEFLVVVDNVSAWYPYGYKLTLNAHIPFYEVGKFVGNFTVPVGSAITVRGFVEEHLVEYINYPLIGRASSVLVIIPVLWYLIKRVKKH